MLSDSELCVGDGAKDNPTRSGNLVHRFRGSALGDTVMAGWLAHSPG